MAVRPIVGALGTVIAAQLSVPVFVADADASITGALVLLVPYNARPYASGGTVAAYTEMVQVRVAASDYAASVELAWSCYRKIVEISTTPADSDRRLIGPIVALQPPFLLGRDEQNRVVHIFNISIPLMERGVE